MVHEMTQFPSPPLAYPPTTTYLYPPPPTTVNASTHHLSTQWPAAQPPHAAAFDGSTPQDPSPHPTVATPAVPKRKARRGGSGKKSGYKHVPHREKPAHLVARRNARERRRVQAVNSAFSRLRKCVPAEGRNKRLSKVKTLHRAIEYIQMLQEVLTRADEELDSGEFCLNNGADSLNKENEGHQRWMPAVTNWENENHNSCLSFYDDFTDPLES